MEAAALIFFVFVLLVVGLFVRFCMHASTTQQTSKSTKTGSERLIAKTKKGIALAVATIKQSIKDQETKHTSKQ